MIFSSLRKLSGSIAEMLPNDNTLNLTDASSSVRIALSRRDHRVSESF